MTEFRQRYIKIPVANDLKTRMVFIGGPRQVGKAIFALTFLPKPIESHPAYLNWDDISRASLLKRELPSNEKILFSMKPISMPGGELLQKVFTIQTNLRYHLL